MQRQHGFTLIELMITVAIVAILSAIAIPNYTDYVRRGKIPEGTAALLAQRTKMEQYYQDNFRYSTTTGGGTCGAALPNPSPKNFTITCATSTNTVNVGDQKYTITATGIGSMDGIVFTINEANTKATTVTASSTMANAGYTDNAACWVSKKGGQC